MLETREADILIIGGGSAALHCALHAYDHDPSLKIIMATKGVLGKGGCSRMVQGGFNVVLNPKDSHEKHFLDTIKGGQFLNNQELAWTLVTQATRIIKELENRYGCFFDRNPDGTIHQKPFAGQCFDRTVHKGDLTGIEIVSRATDQMLKRDLTVLDEHRALTLLFGKDRTAICGALILDIRTGTFLVVKARATVVATGGGPSMYKYFPVSLEKSADGIAMMYRAGCEMVDMEMVQFHPTGLIVPGSIVAGTVLEEGLRGAGARLFNAKGERYMERYAPDVKERATRDIVSRGGYLEIMAGRGFHHGGVHLDASHLGADFVLKNFPGMHQRCADFGYDLGRGPVPVCPTAHYFMAGAVVDKEGKTSLPGLFAAGEDTGGVHGANRLGGNGIADSTVFGSLTGEAVSVYVRELPLLEPDTELIEGAVEHTLSPFQKSDGPNPFQIRDTLRDIMWSNVGVVRNGDDLKEAAKEIEQIMQHVKEVKVRGDRPYNIEWNAWLNLENQVEVAYLVARAAILRKESRGAHYRSDFPEGDNKNYLKNFFVQRGEEGPVFESRPVKLTRLRPEDIQ